MLSSTALAPRVIGSFGRLLAHLGVAAPTDDFAAEAKAWSRAKAERGGRALADALGLGEAELVAFEASARDVDRMLARRAESSAPADERNATLALMRLLAWIETIEGHLDVRFRDGELDVDLSADVGHKQARAIELIVRSLITESHGSQEALLARLREIMSDQVVDGWKAKADPGDLLSGLTFGELASLFVDKDEFARYERLYESTPFLTLLKQRRRTVQSFLDDVRRIRNVLAHNKRVTPTQLTLLDLYYEEIVAPVQTAHDHGETRVDPGAFLDVGRNELERWVGGLKDDVRTVREDLASLRADLGGAVAGVREDTQALRRAARRHDRKLIAIGAGVVATLVGLWFVVRGSEETVRTGEAARAAAERTADVVRDVADRVEDTTARVDATAERVDEATVKVDATAEAVEVAAAKVEEASGDASAAAAAARDAAERAVESTERVARSLDDLQEGFRALLAEGGTIVDADRPEAHYHNARVHEQRGDTAKAMASYRRYFETATHGFVDPHLRYQSLLKLQSGLGGAREIYFTMKEATDDPTTHFAWLLLLETDARARELKAWTDAHPDFAPAWYERSRDVSLARLGSQSFEDKRAEKEALERFLALTDGGTFLSAYLDQQVAAAQVEDARARFAAVGTVAEEVLANPVTLNAMESNAGWGLTFLVAEEAREIFWRRKGVGEFVSTGHQAVGRTASGHPLPTMYVPLSDPAPGVFEVRYTDAKGRDRGPFELSFDPTAQRLAQTKSVLQMTSNAWIAFRDYDEKRLVYFTHLVSYRGSIREIRWSLDGEALDRRFDLPPFDPKNPFAIPADHLPYVTVPPGTRSIAVRLTFIDGTQTPIQTFTR